MKSQKDTLNPDTKIEVIAIKGEEVHKKIITYSEALQLKKKKGWNYLFYQIGFSQF